MLVYLKIHHLWKKAILELISTINKKTPQNPTIWLWHDPTQNNPCLFFKYTWENLARHTHKNAVAKWIKSLHMQHIKRHMTKWLKIFDQIWAVYCAIHGKNLESSNTLIRYYQRLHIHNKPKHFIKNAQWSQKR